MIFLPKAAPPTVVEAYEKAIKAIIARDDFAALSAKTLGDYPQMTGAAAAKAKALATDVPESAKQFVINWLKEDYGVSLN